jgi:hypothetical protein
MGPLDLLLHLANFVAPAAFLAFLLALSAWIFAANRPPAPAMLTHAAITFIAGVAVLGAGLWFFGRDGKMATYAALVGVSATVQWLLSRPGR